MGIEIERKFLVNSNAWQKQADAGTSMQQGYLSSSLQSSVRIRVAGERAFLNIKSATTLIRRLEYDYPIPLDDAREILEQVCQGRLLEKTRYRLPAGRHTWEIDVFSGANQGLVVAEIELADENEAFPHPDWLGEEVSDDPRYLNMNLVEHPYNTW